MRPQVEILEDKADLAAQAIDLLVVGGDQVAIFRGLELEFLTSDENLALVGRFEQIDATQKGRLARAGRAEDGDHVAVARGEGNALDHLEVAIALVQVANFQCWRGLGHGVSSSYSNALRAVAGPPWRAST